KTESGRDIFFHTDAVQASGKVPLDMSKVPVSALSISGHKFHAPKGVGALFLRQGYNVMPITFGGGQEKGLLPGTEGLANIVALGKAAELAKADMDASVKSMREMQRFLIERLEKLPGISMTGSRDLEKRLPGHISLSIENLEGEGLVMQLDMKGVCVSSASACHTGVIEPSHVLTALNLPCSLLKGSVRISLSCFNTLEECETAVNHMEKVFASQKSATNPS
ncbi:MAG: aminotransferase class V-fold PLP-dependent enzyme, partial [Cyanobacteria bacterium]|nr:aminotransferase class V-fold PLP-dependent enzyme [Cyanobacteriota bacterium]